MCCYYRHTHPPHYYPLQNKTSEYCAPLTSFDWNVVDPNVIGTCSIDTTCTIWDVNAKKVREKTKAFQLHLWSVMFLLQSASDTGVYDNMCFTLLR